MTAGKAAQLLVEELSAAHPEARAQVRPVAFDPTLFDVEIFAPDWTATVSLSRDGADARLMIDAYVFENLSLEALLEILDSLLSRSARISVGRGLLGRKVRLEARSATGPRSAERRYSGTLSRWERELSG
jgi:hypothetical protein